MLKMRNKRRFGAALAAALLLSPLLAPAVPAHAESVKDMLRPHAAGYGYYVDDYLNNKAGNVTTTDNPALGLLSEFFQYWSPTKGVLNPTILNDSIAVTAHATQTRTPAEVKRSFLTDRRDLSYDLLSGLGPYQNAFIQNADAKTDYYDVPAAPQPGNTPYSSVTWAQPNSKLGAMVQLVNLTRANTYGGTGVAKQVIKYVRPYRQSPKTVFPNPYLVNVMADSPANDYDFPSGHSTAGFEVSTAMAYAFPERYQQLVTRGTEMGYDRILAGRHSALAVMGGRILGTAITASVLNDPKNAGVMKQAYKEAQSADLLKSPLVDKKDDSFASYQQNRKNYRYRMTYGLPQIGQKNQAMRVPKGAEVLLATRLPYLSATQRREVLYTTGLPSGYPLMDDPEGWGRLDLFSAANGFGRFLDKTKVTMNAAKGGFNARDTFRNNIGGRGSLVKAGTGTLTLAGRNSFSGGVQLANGRLDLDTASAAGTGTVSLKRGTLAADVAVSLRKGYQQGSRSTLALRVTKGTALKIRGAAKLAGTLRLNGLKRGQRTLITFSKRSGKFAHVYGLPKGDRLVYAAHSVRVVRR